MNARVEDRAALLDLFEAALRAVSPSALMPPAIPVASGGRTVAIAIGKAAAEMMRVAQLRAAAPLEGLVVVPYGHLRREDCNWPGVEIVESGHPVPDENSLLAGRRALELADGLKAGDRLLVLLSGGGSAVAAVPTPGVSLADKQAATQALLRSGAAIAEINCVRKHLSLIKGGRLAAAAAPAQVTTWIVADVPGDDPSLVASGPTVADLTDLATARAIVARDGLSLPASVLRALADPANETPGSETPALADTDLRILGGAGTALAAAARCAGERGCSVTNLGDRLEGEAQQLGAEHARVAQSLRQPRPTLLLSGGETSVTLAGQSGRGGRNLEYLLALAIALAGAPGISAIACDTDGIDGASDAAGAMVFPDTLARAEALGLDARAHLERHDSHAFFAALGDLVVTGPTLTNVGDFRAMLVEET